MADDREKVEVLNRLLAAASETWGEVEAENMRSALELAAEAFCTVEVFTLKPMEEPAQQTSIFHQTKKRQGRETSGK
jgi:hypothetical protein